MCQFLIRGISKLEKEQYMRKVILISKKYEEMNKKKERNEKKPNSKEQERNTKNRNIFTIFLFRFT